MVRLVAKELNTAASNAQIGGLFDVTLADGARSIKAIAAGTDIVDEWETDLDAAWSEFVEGLESDARNEENGTALYEVA